MQKSILITGCSSGVGLAAAQILQKKGYRVFATARKEVDVKKLHALGLESYHLDVADLSSIQQMLTDILTKTGGTLDALFNNAGFCQSGAVEELTRNLIREQFETNVFGPMELVMHILPIMRKQGYGRIIQNSSILGIVAMPYYGAYNASKFALEGFSNTLRQELRGTQIFISIIAPGHINTQFRDNTLAIYKKTLPHSSNERRKQYDYLERYFGTDNDKQPPLTVTPETVVNKLIHALESRRPKSRYYAGIPANLLSWMRRLLPDRILDWISSKIIGKTQVK